MTHLTDDELEAPEKTIRLTIDLTYNAESMHGDDLEAIEWFQGIMSGNDLQLGDFGDLGDMIGTVKVVDCTPADERVKALEAENVRLRIALQQIVGGEIYTAADGFSKPHEPEQSRLARAALRDMDATP